MLFGLVCCAMFSLFDDFLDEVDLNNMGEFVAKSLCVECGA